MVQGSVRALAERWDVLKAFARVRVKAQATGENLDLKWAEVSGEATAAKLDRELVVDSVEEWGVSAVSKSAGASDEMSGEES